MEEILVITACFYQKGCQETSSAYYVQRPQFREFAERTEIEIKEAVGPIAVNYLAPMAVFAAGATGTMRIEKHLGLKYNKQTFEIIFKKDF